MLSHYALRPYIRVKFVKVLSCGTISFCFIFQVTWLNEMLRIVQSDITYLQGYVVVSD